MPVKKPNDAAEIFKKVLGPGGVGDVATWADADSTLVYRLIVAVVNCGGLISFAKAGKGRAYLLTILHDEVAKDEQKRYITGADTLDEHLRGYVDQWEAIEEAMRDAKLI